MTVKKLAIKNQAPQQKPYETEKAPEQSQESMAVMILKTKAYNLIAQVDHHRNEIEKLQQQLQQNNQEIIKTVQAETRANK